MLYFLVFVSLIVLAYIVWKKDRGEQVDTLPTVSTDKEEKNPLDRERENNISVTINLSDVLSHGTENTLSRDINIVGGRTVWIKSLGFDGVYSTSPNERYIVATSDTHREGGRRVNGRVVFIDQTSVLYDKEMQRPHDAKVSNNGDVIVNDWLNTTNPAGVFYVIDKYGLIRIKYPVKASLCSNDISINGIYAAFATVGDGNESDSDATFLFDIQEYKLISKIGYSSIDIRIDEVSKTIHFDESRMHTVFSFNGECVLGHDPTNPSWLKHCSGYDLYTVLSADLDQLEETSKDTIDYDYFISYFKEAMHRIPSVNWKSKILIHLGDIYQKINNHDDAKQCYLEAIALNPKAPVKRKLYKLS